MKMKLDLTEKELKEFNMDDVKNEDLIEYYHVDIFD